MFKRLLLLINFLVPALIFGQLQDHNFTIPKEDSITIYEAKVKVSRLINPQPDSALYYIKKIERLSVEKSYVVGKAEAYYLFASYYRRVQKMDSSLYFFDRLLQHSNENNYIKGKSLAFNGMCRINYLLGNVDVAMQSCLDCLSLQDQITDGFYNIIPDTHIALASTYIRKNELEPATKHLLMVDSIHNTHTLRPDIIAAAYQSLGNIYTQLEDYNASEMYFLKANEQFKLLPAQAANFYMETTNRHLGEVYYHQGKYETADSLLTNSRDFFKKIKDERTVSEINTALGLVKIKTNDHEAAEAYLKEALELNKNNIFDYEASQSGIELAKLYLLKKRSAKAIVTLEDVLLYNQGNQNSGINHQVFELLADAYAQQRNYSSAYTNLHKAKQIKDSLNQFQGAARIKEIEGKYQTESRDREIALLTSQNELAEQQKTNQRNLLLGGLGITGLLGLFFFVQYHNRQKTNRKLKELDLAKSTFFANISHEFRTPLTLIKGPIDDQLASGNLNKSERFNLQTASSNANRLESLVDQLLALSRLESGNLKLQVQPGNLPQFIAAQLESFHFRSKEKDIEMVSRVTEDEQLDWFDRDALQKVVFNLIGNAVKYTPTHGTIEISGKRNDGSYIFSILNSGTTLSPEQRSRIFERFYQTSDQNTGTGIGLALTKELVELHKGKIHLPETAKGFTMFQVEIPTHRGAFEDSEILSEELQQWDHYPKGKVEVFDAPTEIAAEDAPLLLIVDDNSEIRTYVKSLFDGIYKVHEAADGADGFEQAIELIPDIVISDVMMPVEDGYSLTRRIKDNELTSHIPVILLTAKTDDADKLLGTETGADSYVTKPFNSELLKARAQNLLDIRRKLQQRFAQEVILKPREVTMTSADERFIERLQLVFDEQLTNPNFSVDKLSREMGVSRMQLHRKLKALTGRSSSEFIRSHRLKLAIQLLKENNATVAEIGYSVGFNDPSYFTKCFKQEYGCSPTEYSPVSN